jgi:hypothetical protein
MLCKNILCVKIYQKALIGCSDICWHGIFWVNLLALRFHFVYLKELQESLMLMISCYLIILFSCFYTDNCSKRIATLANNFHSFLRIFILWSESVSWGGDQYAIALALLDEGKVALGVLACPNLPLSSTNNLNGNSAGDQVRRPVSHKNWLWGWSRVPIWPPQKVIALLFWLVVLRF